MARDVWGDYVTPDMFEEAERNGICKSTVKSRIGNGLKAREAVSRPLQHKYKKDAQYQQYKRQALEGGISASAFYQRIKRGWDLDAAANTPLLDARESTKRGREARSLLIPKNISSLAMENGICRSTLYYRIIKGMDKTKAATMSPMTTQERSRRWFAQDWRDDTLYKTHYAHGLAYIGRTNQKLSSRLRGHFFKKRMHREIDIDAVTLIEYAELPSVADMYCYEVLLINALKPMYNHDDKAGDELSAELVTLCDRLEFKPYVTPLMEKWKVQIAERDRADAEKRKAEIAREIEQREMRRKKRAGEITEDEYFDWMEESEL